jgi:xylulokinase
LSDELVGVDVGTSGAKVVVIDDRGTVLRTASREYPMMIPRPGWTEQDPADWARAVRECLAKVQKSSDDRGIIGFTGQMHGSVFLDGRDQVIRPALLWNDQRTAAECGAIEATVGAERLRKITGNPALTSFQLPKLLWLRKHEAAAAARVRSLMLPKDYVRHCLTGERVMDVADGSGIGAFDLQNRTLSDSVLSAFDVDRSLFPPVRECAEVAGAGDQAAGAVGTGAVREGVVSVSIGTSGVVFAALQELPARRDDAVNLFCHATGKWHAMTVMLSAGASLRWLRDTMYAPDASYDVIVQDASRVTSDLVFLPYLAGERSPHVDPDVRGAFVGLALHHTRAHMARAVIEGITFGLLDGLNALRQTARLTVSEVRVTGGGAKSAWWRQLIADVFRVPVVTLACDEGPAFGAAILAGVRSGVWASVEAACDAVVRTTSRTEPTGVSYEEQYERFRALYPKLR